MAFSLTTKETQAAQVELNNHELTYKIDVVQRVWKSGDLVFCGGEVELYTLEQLMRASAEPPLGAQGGWLQNFFFLFFFLIKNLIMWPRFNFLLVHVSVN